MLRKRLSTRIDLNSFKYLKKEKNFLASQGCFVLQQDPVTGFVSVYDAVTTDRRTVDREERSVRRIKDRVRKDVRKGLEDWFIGQKNLTDQLNSVEMHTLKMLDSFVDAQILNDKRNIKAKVGNDPREILLSFEILPVFPLRWVTINMTVSGK